MSKEKKLFGNTEADGGNTEGEADAVLDEENTQDNSTEGTEKPKRKREASPATKLKIELKNALRQKALGTSGLTKLEEQKAELTTKMTALDAKIAEAKAIGSGEELDAKIAKLQADLLEAITAEVS